MNENIEITAKDNHQFSAYISQPSGKPKAGIVIIQEIFGVNTHIKEVTDLYASKGYLCIAPSLFDRIEKNVTLNSVMSNSFGFGGTNATLIFEKV